MNTRVRFAFSILSTFFFVTAGISAFADSHVRIVRLSSVEGQVQIDRATGEGLERAILNTPIVEGTRIVTGDDGLVEVEFENQSALRIAGNSDVRFSQLLMNSAGDKVNQIEVVKGLVYLDSARGNDIYRFTVGDQTLLAHRDTLMRLDAGAGKVQVAVFKGDVQLEGQPQPVNVQKKETLTFNTKDAASSAVAKGVDPSRFDNWNKEREAYTSTYAENDGESGPTRGYGLQDLNYYGSYFYAPGYGTVWQPYGFTSALTSWSPYSNGAWMFYPGTGYSWASAYPWGWLPYHYGSWAFINGTGWAWLPGNAYRGQWYANSYRGVPVINRAPVGWAAPTPPATLAGSAVAPTVLVGRVGTSPAQIPGGRIPPVFGSVIPGRTLSASAGLHGWVAPNANAGTRTAFVRPTAMGYHGYSGHVFAQPMARSVGMLDMTPGFGGAAAMRGMGPHLGEASHAGMSIGAAHSATASSGGAHK